MFARDPSGGRRVEKLASREGWGNLLTPTCFVTNLYLLTNSLVPTQKRHIKVAKNHARMDESDGDIVSPKGGQLGKFTHKNPKTRRTSFYTSSKLLTEKNKPRAVRLYGH